MDTGEVALLAAAIGAGSALLGALIQAGVAAWVRRADREFELRSAREERLFERRLIAHYELFRLLRSVRAWLEAVHEGKEVTPRDELKKKLGDAIEMVAIVVGPECDTASAAAVDQPSR